MDTPLWALTLAYWLHMLATVVWIGGLAALVLFVLPGAQRQLPAGEYAAVLDSYQRRLDALGWMSIAVLLSTGLVQMSANPNYEGFFSVGNLWSIAILSKHLVFFGMIGLSAYLTWGLFPAIRRAALLRSRGQEAPEVDHLSQRQRTLVRLNLILGVIVLGLTAIARAS